MSKTCKTDAMVKNRLICANCRPGQILQRVKKSSINISSACYSPSPKTKCNIGWIPDIGIELALIEESLRIELVRIGISFRVMQHCPIPAVICTRVKIEKRKTRTICSLLQRCLLV